MARWTPPADHLGDELRRWVGAGLLSPRQADAILAHEGRPPLGAAHTAPTAQGEGTRRVVPAVAEALGYLGGALAVVGLGLVAGRAWPDLSTASRLALAGTAMLALLGAGFAVRAGEADALARFRGVLWLVSTAAAGLFAGVSADAMGAEAPTSVALASSSAATIESGVLWRGRVRPLQQLTFLAGTAVVAGAAVSSVVEGAAAGLAVWLVGSAWLAAGLGHRTPDAVLTDGVGALATVVGSLIVASAWEGTGLAFGLATGMALLALASTRRLPTTKGDRRVVAAIGVIAVVQVTPGTLGYFARDGGAATGLATFVVGALLLVAAARAAIRVPLAAELSGGVAMIGGAAITAAQWEGFAPLVGIATGILLLVLGALRDRIVLSALGSLALLVNVPWAIAHYFPGQGRAPLLIFVTGAIVLGVAVLVSRNASSGSRPGAHRRGRRPPGMTAGPAPS